MTAVAIEDVWKYYGDYPALQSITFNVERGKCLALLGRNGAGKTTLLRILAGLSRCSRGRITILDHDARDEAARRQLSVLGHGIGVYDELTAMENLILFARLYSLKDPRKVAAEWLERTGLSRVRDGKVREFSRGMRQRLAVARAFLHRPSLMILDEPFTALDDRAIKVLQDLMRSVLAEGATIIMSTHQLREALELATDVALINRGRLAFRGERTREMLEDPGWLYRHYGEA
jgi:heme ABC exporter ATP-binding subunit CcmA